MKNRLSLLVITVLLLLALIMLNLTSGLLLADKRLDVTKNGDYTLSANTIKVVNDIGEQINITFYISDNFGRYDQDLKNYAGYVSGILAQYQRLNPDKLKFEIKKISPYSAIEQDGVKNGMIPVMVEGENTYFGLKIATMSGKTKVIPYLEVQRRNYLETDLNRIIYNLSEDRVVNVGITAPNLPLFGGSRKQKNWSLLALLQDNYNLVEVPDNLSYVPLDMDVLILLNPQELPQQYIYALDQYLMRGGKLLIFVDPYSEILHFYRGYPPVGKTNITKLIESFGIYYDADVVVGDAKNAEKVSIEANGVTELKTYPLWTFVSAGGFSQLHFRTPGALSLRENGDIAFKPLAATSNNSGNEVAANLRYNPRSRVISLYQETNQEYVLAVRATGDFRSNFYLNPVGLDNAKMPPYLPIALNNGAELVIVADSDFVSDDAWVLQSTPQNPIYGTIPYASNADFIINLIDEMSGRAETVKYGDLSAILAKSNIALNIYTKLYEASSGHISEIEKEEIKLSNALSDAKNKLQYAGHGEMLEYRKQVDDIEKQLATVRSEHQYLDYAINNAVEDKLNLFMILSLVLCPLCILLLLWLTMTTLRKFNGRTAK